jgi:hypothetical protein
MRSVEARTWFHLGAWAGLSATVYTNYQAAPVADLQVAYLVVPVLMAALSEGLIRTWEALDARVRTLLTALLFALVATSYEHLRSLTLDAHGTRFAANVGSAVIDGAIFGCVLATATLTRSAPLRSGAEQSAPLLHVAPVSAPPEQSTPAPAPLSAPVAPVPELEDSAPEWFDEIGTVALPEWATALRTPLRSAPEQSAPLFAAPPLVTPEPEQSAPERSDDAPLSASPLRSADRGGERERMVERFGQNAPTHTEVRALFGCGDSKAARILREYREHQE